MRGCKDAMICNNLPGACVCKGALPEYCRSALAPVGTFPPFACHCVLCSCKRRRVSVFSMSLRTSAHTGVAIRVPAEIPGKTVVHRANSQLLRICREELLFVLCCCKENGLPRRFAPRNDMLKTGRCQRLQERITGANLQLFRICPKYCFSFCPTARRTDCHVASLLAMTCRRWAGVSVCKNVSPGQIRSFYVFAVKNCFSFCAAARRTDCHVAGRLPRSSQ